MPTYELFAAGAHRDALLSECGRYRYWLLRAWGEGPSVCFIMLNPSTANALVDDPTIRRCVGFAKSWGFDALEVLNLFALRATDPRELLTASDPIGPRCNDYFAAGSSLMSAPLVIAAWGAKVPFGRDRQVLAMLQGRTLHCLGTTKDGHPKHPLYIPADRQPVPFTGAVTP